MFLRVNTKFLRRMQQLGEWTQSFSRKHNYFVKRKYFMRNCFSCVSLVNAILWWENTKFVEETNVLRENANPMASFNLHGRWTHWGSIGLPACVISVMHYSTLHRTGEWSPTQFDQVFLLWWYNLLRNQIWSICQLEKIVFPFFNLWCHPVHKGK